MPPTELIPVANVLLLPSGVDLRIEPLKVVAASSETKRFPLLSKHKPIGPLSPATKVLFVPSGVYLNTECLDESATYRLPAASKASPLARTLTGINIVVRTVAVRLINSLFIYLSIPGPHSRSCYFLCASPRSIRRLQSPAPRTSLRLSS